MTSTNNIILIGMPASGKSSLGQQLAQQTGREFVDTDDLIAADEGKSLQAIVDSKGYRYLREAEERNLLALEMSNGVIATGGSAVYSDTAMQHLKRSGWVILLDLNFDSFLGRIQNFENRGLARPKNQTLAQLYDERLPLYRRYADLAIDCNGLSQQAVLDKLLEHFG